ncbi:MAG: OmpA family protein [Nitrospirales bacterium]|nr:OmpA family protein [Nitrospirales bacterium]
MVRIPRKLERSRVFLAMACAGILLGTDAIALTESAPLKFTGPTEVKLAAEQSLALQGGYLQPFPESAAGVLQGSREAKRLLGFGDIVRVRLAPTTDAKVGDRFTIFRPTAHVYHPATRDYMGRHVVILGIIEIYQESDAGVALAKIVQAFDSVTAGDLLKPFAIPPPIPAQQVTSGPVAGLIVDFKASRGLMAQGEIVYIDRGEADGVALGDRFTITRRGRRLSAGEGNLDIKFAEIKIIGLQARTATGYVLNSIDALQHGDTIARLPPPPPKAEPVAAPPKEATSDAMAVAKAAPSQAKPAAPPAPAMKAFEDVYFDSGKSTLTDQARKTLTDHTDYLKQNPALAITIEGYADDRGSAQSGLTIGEKRAQEVRRFLADLGVKNTLMVTSFGKDRPVCTEKTAACHAKNRRVHLAVGN